MDDKLLKKLSREALKIPMPKVIPSKKDYDRKKFKKIKEED